MVNGWVERPKCNIIGDCGKPSVVLMNNKFCCEEHLLKFYHKQEAAIQKMMEEE